MWERRIELLPLLNPPVPSRLRESPAARATWGDVCSLARRISSFGNLGACMKPDFLPVGFFCAPICCARCYRKKFVAREWTPINSFFGISWNQPGKPRQIGSS